MTKLLHLDLDELYGEGYYYTEFDVGGSGHDIWIHPEDREAFLDAFAAKWRGKAAEWLVEEDIEWYRR